MWEESLLLKSEKDPLSASAFPVLDQLSCLIYWGLTFSVISFSDKIPAEVFLIIVVKFFLWLGCLSPGLRPQCIPGVSWPPYILLFFPSRCQSG